MSTVDVLPAHGGEVIKSPKLETIEPSATRRLRKRAIALQSNQLSYSLLCGVLANKWQQLDKTNSLTGVGGETTVKEIKRLLSALINLASKLLETKLFNVISPREAEIYRQDILLYNYLLELLDELADEDNKLAKVGPKRPPLVDGLKELENNQVEKSTSMAIRQAIGSSNWYRLFFIRLKRICEALAPVLRLISHNNVIKDYAQVIDKINKGSHGFLALLSWGFFLPRLSANLILAFKNTIPGWWMSEQQKSLAWYVRLKQDMAKRWFELVNDSIWVVGGVLTCFVLTGAVGSYLTFALYGADCVVMAIKCVLERRKLNKQYQLLTSEISVLEAQLRKVNQGEITIEQNQLNKINEEISTKSEMLYQCQRQMDYQFKRGLLSFSTTVGLFAAVGLTLPFIANPVIVLLGASIVVAICLTSFISQKILEKQNPEKKVTPTSVIKTSFFKQVETNSKVKQRRLMAKSPSCESINSSKKSQYAQRPRSKSAPILRKTAPGI